MNTSLFFLYGPPASGKSTLAKALAPALGGCALDLDEIIVQRIGMSIADYFQAMGESAFRKQESEALRELVSNAAPGLSIIALGGGTLLDEGNRLLCETAGTVLCLDAPDDAELERRFETQVGSRPLGNKAKERAAHYATFPHRISRSFFLSDSLVLAGTGIASAFMLDFMQPKRLVIDENVANLYPELSSHSLFRIPSGEQYKTPDTLMKLWHAFADAGISRQGSVWACGGGVTGDLTGFAAATWMRGISWINVPTTLLSMVDASTGGKTGCDLPEGKNLAGVFHSPKLVLIDTDFLKTLSQRELRSGISEMIKHSIIGAQPGIAPTLHNGIPSAKDIADSLAVKIDIVSQDPHETLGKRILLNCGHTIAHAIETASNYALSHGEAVAIGCIEEARLAVKQGLAPDNWPTELATHFSSVGLPVQMPEGMSFEKLTSLMKRDKKAHGNEVNFALPCGWGMVRPVRINLEA